MCRTMRAVAAALIVTIIGALSVSAWAGGENPFDPFGGPPPSRKKAAKSAPSPMEVRSRGMPAELSTTAEQRIERALCEKTKLQFQDAELGEVVAHLKRVHNIEIQLDKESLEEYDLGSDTLITCVIKDISLRSALRLMLRELELTFIIKDEVLLITTEEVAYENQSRRVYEVADLVTYRDNKGELWTDYDPLVDTITAAIEPDSWVHMGGASSITGNDFSTAKVLVVNQTEKVHTEIAGLLGAIRNVVAQTPGDGQPPRRSRPKDGTIRRKPDKAKPIEVMGSQGPM